MASENAEQNEMITGRIYKITSAQTDGIYIGSTIKSLNERLARHKSDYKRYLSGNYHYVSSFEIVKHNDCVIMLIEEIRIESIRKLSFFEQLAIDAEPNCINKHKAFGSVDMSEYGKQYYQTHQAYKREYGKQYCQAHQARRDECTECECGMLVRKRTMAAHKESLQHIYYMRLFGSISPDPQQISSNITISNSNETINN